VAEGQILQDAISVGWIGERPGSEGAAALGFFGLQQVPLAGVHAHDFAAGGYFEPLGNGFLGLNAFGASHLRPFLSRRRALYGEAAPRASGFFNSVF
jgi:hypothetical protein